MNKDFTSDFASSDVTEGGASSGALSLADFDDADFRHYLDGLSLSDEEASELLHILWDMMRMCIEMDLPAESWGRIVSPLFLSAATDSATLK